MRRAEKFKRKDSSEVQIGINKEFTSEYVGTPICFGTLEDGTEVVLKFNNLDGGAEREFFGLTLAFNNQIPTSRPIAMITRDSDSRLGFLMEKVDGKPFREFGSELHEQLFALALLKLHSIQVSGYGTIHTGKAQFKNYNDYLKMWLDKTTPYMEMNGGDMSLFYRLKQQGDSHMKSQTPKAIHRDPKDENVLITPDNKISLIDFEWVQGGNPLDDVAVYLYHAIRTNKDPSRIQAFMNTYFKGRELNSGEKHDLLFHLMLASGRTVSYCSRFNQGHLSEAVKDMNKVTDYIRQVLSLELR